MGNQTEFTSIDEFLENEIVDETTDDLFEPLRESMYCGIDDIIDDVEENGVYKNDIFGIHENESEDEDDETLSEDFETTLRKHIDKQFKENCYQ